MQPAIQSRSEKSAFHIPIKPWSTYLKLEKVQTLTLNCLYKVHMSQHNQGSPMFSLKLDGISWRLMADSGMSINIINEKKRRQDSKLFSELGSVTMLGDYKSNCVLASCYFFTGTSSWGTYGRQDSWSLSAVLCNNIEVPSRTSQDVYLQER